VTPPGPKQPNLLFKLGRIMATPRAIEALAVAGQIPDAFLLRHQTGDWGELSQDDKAANDLAVTAGARILSAYLTILGERIWIITEADRSLTTILLPGEY
jgi:hypothetical protein